MKYRKSIAFTIAELCVVLTFIAILIIILLPSLANSRQYSKKALCQANLFQQGRAMQMFVNDNDGWTADPWYFQFGNGNLWTTDWLPMWSRDSKKHPDQPDGTYPDGLLWPYLQTEDVWQCPNIPYNPVYGPWGSGSQYVYWGFPDARWSYTANAQPGYDPGSIPWNIKPERVKPSPTSVFMIFEQWPYDAIAYDNTVNLYNAYYSPGADSLSDCHGGGGNMVFFDGHVEWMHREDDYLQRVSTVQGTLDLCGGYMGFTW